MAEKKRNPFIWVVMGLLFVGLLGFGTGGLGGNIRTLGTVGDKDVTINAFQAELNNQIRAAEAQLGTRITLPQAREAGLDQAALQRVIFARTLDNEATEIGLSVGDARVQEEVLRIPTFQNLQGQFDREGYRLALQNAGQTEAQFEANIRDEIARTILQSAVFSGIPSSDVFAQTLVNFGAENRKVTFATLTSDDLTAPVPGPTEADITSYYEANPAPFTAPETRQITYAWVTPDMIQDDVNIPDETVLGLYEERIETYVRPERRLVERLVYPDQAAAEAALASLSDDITFETLVENRGLTLSDVDMGDLGREDLGAAADAVFDAAPGDVVGPFNTSLGPALFRMNAVLAATTVGFDQAAPDLRAELATDQAVRQIAAQIEQITDFIAGGATLEDLAERTDLQIGQIAWTPETTEGIAAYDNFRAAAATVETGDFLSLEELADGGVFALRLDEVTPPTLRPLENVRDAVAEAWTADRTTQMLMEQARDIATQISPLTGFDTLGLNPIEADRVTRTTFVEGTPPEFRDLVFEMEPGQVEVLQSGANALIVRLDTVSAPDPEDPQTAAQLDAVAQQGAQGIAQDLFDAFATAVQARTDVNIDPNRLNAVMNSY